MPAGPSGSQLNGRGEIFFFERGAFLGGADEAGEPAGAGAEVVGGAGFGDAAGFDDVDVVGLEDRLGRWLVRTVCGFS